MIGIDIEKPLPKEKEELLRWTIKPAARAHMFLSGVVWIEYKERTDIDYKKWLGPDWKCSFEGAGL